jgi:uncharacterized protein YegL
MGLNDFTIKKQDRALPVFILADTSGSMSENGKIQMLNVAIRDMISSLASIDDIRGVFKVCIITFGGNVELHQSLTDVKSISLAEMTANGKTPMGAAFELLSTLVADKNIISSTAYIPTVVMISDGLPTDIDIEDATYDDYINWEPLKKLHGPNNRVSKCLKLAMGVGDDADHEMLKAFVNDAQIPIFHSEDSSGIEHFFKWVTMSTVSRMTSHNPNDTHSMLPIEIDQDELPL